MARETEEKRIERESLCLAFKESGQGMTAFSRERGVPFWTLRSAVKKTEREALKESGFQEIALPKNFGVEYVVVLRSGRELRIPGEFLEKRLRQLIGILETC